MLIRQYRPWYVWVTGLASAVQLLMALGVLLLVNHGGARSPLLLALAVTAIGLGVLLIAWSSWAVPFLVSGDRRFLALQPPAQEFHRIRWALCGVLPACIVTFAALFLSLDLWDLHTNPNRTHWHWSALTTFYLPVFVLAGVLSLLHLRFCAFLHRRFRRTARTARVCFQCGYDLHGTPHAPTCPECGAPCPPSPADGSHRTLFPSTLSPPPPPRR